MYTSAEKCPHREGNVQHGNGIIRMKDLATKEQMYDHARLFSHITVDPGCSIGYHTHTDETEFYYILRGDAVFSDNGTESVLHTGDIAATGYGEGHSLENRTDSPVELIALIVTK
jgi:uncharacterized cupin superfamily protein